MKKTQIALIIVAAILTVAAIIVLILKYTNDFFAVTRESSISQNSEDTTIDENTSSTDETVVTSTVYTSTTPDGKDQIGDYNIVGNLRDYSRNFLTGTIKVVWNKQPIQLTAAEENEIWKKIDPDKKKRCALAELNYFNNCAAYIFKGGTISSTTLSLGGKTLYYLYLPDQPGIGPSTLSQFKVVLDDVTNKFIFIATESWRADMFTMYYANSPLVDAYSKFIGGIISYTNFEELVAPNSLNIPGQDSVLVKNNSGYGAPIVFYTTSTPKKGNVNTSYEKVTKIDILKLDTTDKFVFTDQKYGSVYFNGSCYKLVLPDGSQPIYDVLPYFLKENDPNIDKYMYQPGYPSDLIWNNATTSVVNLLLSGDIKTGHCFAGVTACTNIVNNEKWFDENNLKQIATTKKGEGIFELKNKKDAQIYKNLYDYIGMTTPTFSMFLAEEPLVFWKDWLGNWRAYQKAQYVRAAECGKPVIYLYPKTETNINVQVEPNGGFSKTDPFYPETGWQVNAMPDSRLTDLSDGKTYPYLFWEGKAYDYQTPDYGFLISKNNVKTKMTELLGKLGLNKKETTDFLEFWQSRLEVKPHVFVTFIPQKDFDRIAPLTISPRPDKIIRIFMDYKPLDKPSNVTEPNITTPSRVGFTVVEWGGRLLK